MKKNNLRKQRHIGKYLDLGRPWGNYLTIAEGQSWQVKKRKSYSCVNTDYPTQEKNL